MFWWMGNLKIIIFYVDTWWLTEFYTWISYGLWHFMATCSGRKYINATVLNVISKRLWYAWTSSYCPLLIREIILRKWAVQLCLAFTNNYLYSVENFQCVWIQNVKPYYYNHLFSITSVSVKMFFINYMKTRRIFYCISLSLVYLCLQTLQQCANANFIKKLNH